MHGGGARAGRLPAVSNWHWRARCLRVGSEKTGRVMATGRTRTRTRTRGRDHRRRTRARLQLRDRRPSPHAQHQRCWPRQRGSIVLVDLQRDHTHRRSERRIRIIRLASASVRSRRVGRERTLDDGRSCRGRDARPCKPSTAYPLTMATLPE